MFVLLSSWEGNPLSFTETMAARRPVIVIVTKVGGVTDLVEDGVSGLPVPPGDKNTLAKAMEVLYLTYGKQSGIMPLPWM